jgi:thiamine biosynthesis lipoprotein
VNAAAGSWTDVSPAFEDVADLAIGAAALTEGRFDPSVLDAILACGYDRDFDEVIAGARGALRPPRPCGRWNEIERRPGRILLPAGVSLDFGGIAKGWTVDRAAEDAVAAGLPWALVDAGGDLRLNGDAPELEVAVEDPERPPTELVRLRLRTGALATSTTAKRAWGPGLHHLIDPATGAPATGRVIQATVWAPTCAEAEVAAKDALLRDDAEASAQPGVLLTADGQVTVSVEEAA